MAFLTFDMVGMRRLMKHGWSWLVSRSAILTVIFGYNETKGDDVLSVIVLLAFFCLLLFLAMNTPPVYVVLFALGTTALRLFVCK